MTYLFGSGRYLVIPKLKGVSLGQIKNTAKKNFIKLSFKIESNVTSKYFNIQLKISKSIQNHSLNV
jgi:hypothetical protein